MHRRAGAGLWVTHLREAKQEGDANMMSVWWIAAIGGSVAAVAVLTGAGVLFWLIRRFGSKKPQHQ
jgi:hypothetical protein